MNKTIKKSIPIYATKEKVWEVLLNDEFTRQWYAEFSEGTHAETDWSVGSKALFTDNTGGGLIGKIIENKRAEILSVEYQGSVENGKEEYDTEMAKAVKGGMEIYKLSEINGVTDLTISCDMGEDYFDMMSLAWDKALQKIKGLSEKEYKSSIVKRQS
ncbi:MAG: SRPBCC family protein [Flavisolibacter sp.]